MRLAWRRARRAATTAAARPAAARPATTASAIQTAPGMNADDRGHAGGVTAPMRAGARGVAGARGAWRPRRAAAACASRRGREPPAGATPGSSAAGGDRRRRPAAPVPRAGRGDPAQRDRLPESAADSSGLVAALVAGVVTGAGPVTASRCRVGCGWASAACVAGGRRRRRRGRGRRGDGACADGRGRRGRRDGAVGGGGRDRHRRVASARCCPGPAVAVVRPLRIAGRWPLPGSPVGPSWPGSPVGPFWPVAGAAVLPGSPVGPLAGVAGGGRLAGVAGRPGPAGGAGWRRRAGGAGRAGVAVRRCRRRSARR